MPDNLPPTFVDDRALPDLQLLSLRGPDAVTFSQAQFANDVPSLGVLHWQWSCWLTSKGRVIAPFALAKLATDHIVLLLADGHADEIASQLQRFVFRRKVAISVRADLRAAIAFTAPEAASGAAIAHPAEDVFELDMGSDALPRRLRIVPAADAPVDADAATTLAWRQADLRFGLPRLDAGQREQWTPQQIGLDRLNGYSVKKGCYPGQEIVARTHFLGKAKRSLALLRVDVTTTTGDKVEREGTQLGSIASVAGDLALAVLPLDLEAGPLQVAGAEAAVLPLLEGLAR